MAPLDYAQLGEVPSKATNRKSKRVGLGSGYPLISKSLYQGFMHLPGASQRSWGLV